MALYWINRYYRGLLLWQVIVTHNQTRLSSDLVNINNKWAIFTRLIWNVNFPKQHSYESKQNASTTEIGLVKIKSKICKNHYKVYVFFLPFNGCIILYVSHTPIIQVFQVIFMIFRFFLFLNNTSDTVYVSHSWQISFFLCRRLSPPDFHKYQN